MKIKTTYSKKGIPIKTLNDLPIIRKQESEPMATTSIRVKISLIKKLKQKSKERGYSQQEILNRALEAFLK